MKRRTLIKGMAAGLPSLWLPRAGVDGFLQTFLVFNLQQHLLLITGIAISFSWLDFEWLVRYWHLRKLVNETSAVISLQKNSKKSDPNFE